MARHSLARTVASSSSTPALARGSPAIAQPVSSASPQLRELRRQWKWAALSQFFYTFAPLIALEDVTLVDIEEDLVDSTMVVLPRLMQRLLITLSHDRKITVENWQTALRRQYLRRDPDANPIGIEPITLRNSRATTVESELGAEHQGEFEDSGDDKSQRENDEQKDVASAGTSEANHDITRTNMGASSDVNGATKPDNAGGLPLGTKSEEFDDEVNPTKNWADLTMLEKLESIHTVIEWHFQTPLRLRTVMRSDDDVASWRIEPIGYDAKRNSYWLIGPDRLWIQRAPPKPSQKSLKRKSTLGVSKRKSKAPRIAETETVTKRELESGSSIETRSKRNRGARRGEFEETPTSTPEVNGRARAAKTQANVKLDLQARQLAAAKAEMQSYNRRASSRFSPSKHGTLGTRTSRRLRGNDDDDEWQQIPPEWLAASEGFETKTDASSDRANGEGRLLLRRQKRSSATSEPRSSVNKTWLDSGDESDLTELSDPEVPRKADGTSAAAHEAVTEETQGVYKDDEPPTCLPIDFIEWETLCVSLQEWEAISQQFEKTTHYLEKALYKLLSQEIVPYVTESLREAERHRAKEEALMNRKRSSRIAIKETEKESARIAAARQAEEEGKMARMRRLEARTRKEEEERLKREQGREQRRKEREERELLRRQRLEQTSVETNVHATEPPSDTIGNGSSETIKFSRPSHRNDPKGYTKQVSSDDWELDCEVCGAKGVNRDEGVPLMSCGRCNKWQHIACHDAVDKRAGKTLRNWDAVDFTCKECLAHSLGSPGRSRQKVSRVHTEKGALGPRATASSVKNGNRPEARRPHTESRMVANGRDPYFDRSDLAQSQAPGVALGHHSVSATSKKNLPYQSQAPMTFAHYQPLQRGFSPHPTALHPQFQSQPHGVTHPALPYQPPLISQGMAMAWNPQTQSYVYLPQTNGHGASQPSYSSVAAHPNDVSHGPSSPQTQQPYSITSNNAVPGRSTQAVPYPQAYSNLQHQTTYGDQPLYHPQV
ncbi:hypothetical protein M0805_004411 [Coniferiporia weirii]|nr:hypothetical protein M0805_004411 [Coniferiporia weirii]